MFFLLLGHATIVFLTYTLVPFAPLVPVQVLNGYFFFVIFVELLEVKRTRHTLGAVYGIVVWVLVRRGGWLH